MFRNLLYMVISITLLGAWLYLMQPRMVFFPFRDIQATPSDWGLEYEDVRLPSADGPILHGWYIPSPGARRVLLFFHGNAGNISHRRESVEIFHRLGLNVLIIDYRGYGHSEGSPDEAGLYQDADAAWQYLLNKRGFEGRDVIVFGRSLGGAVAARLVSRLPATLQPGGLILESSFSSARDLARRVFPVLSWITVVRFEFDSIASLQAVSCPVMILHSPDDEIMPFAQGKRLYDSANSPKTFYEMRGDHNTGFMLSQPGYERALAAFLGALP